MGACLYGGYRRKIYPLYSVAYITSSLSKEWERAFLWVSRKNFFYGINFDAAARFALWRWHQNWCHSTKTRFRLSFLAPKRSQFLAKPPLTTLPQPFSLKNDIDFEIFWKYFLSVVFAGNERLYSARPSTSVQQHEGQKKRHGFSKNLSTKLPKPAPLKKRHLFFAFLLRWSAVADSGVIFSALSSTPVPHGFEAKSKHRAENFLLLLYRNIQSQKVNTASKSFLKSPLFLYRNIERKIFNINFKNAANAPHSLTATSEANKRHQFLKVPRKFTN